MTDDNSGQTHWVGCYKERKHHACALAEIERLQALIEQLTDRLTENA